LPIPARILVVDDQQFVRQTLCALLMRRSQWKIYEAADGRAAVDRAREVQPDVAVIDLVMPKMNGLAAAYELRKLSPQTKIILISSHYVKEEAAHLVRLLGDGAFVPKSEIGKDLVPAINSLLPEESQAH
jgi:DNA-binding NarL/FixJ family response regulator